MAYDSTKIIKQVAVGGSTYDVEALWFGGKSYEEIVSMITQARMRTKVDEKSSTKEEPKTAASASTVGWIYLVALTGQKSGSYTEFITVESGSGTSTTYSWERIGTTDTDLSDYVKHGTYNGAAQTGGPTATDSAGSQTASGSATITYKKSADATGSAGDGSSSNTGNAGAATVSVTGASFSGTKATLTQSAHKHSFSGSTPYTPAGSVTHAADSTATVLTGVKVTGSTTVIKTVSAGTAATKQGVKVSTSAAETGTVGVSYTKQTLGGTTTFNTDAIKSVTLSASTVTTDGPAYIESISGSAPSLGGQKAVPTNAIKAVSLTPSTTSTDGPEYIESVSLPTMTAINFTQNTLQSLTTKNYGFASSLVNTNDANGFAQGVMYHPIVTNGVLSWSTTAASSQDVLSTGSKASLTGGVFTAGSKTTKYMKANGTLADTNNVTISGGSYSGVTKYMKATGTAAQKGTVTISDGAVSLTGTTTFAKSGLASAELAEDTSTTPAFKFNTDAIKGVNYTTVSVATAVGSDGTTVAVTGVGALGFSGTAATISISGDTGDGGAVNIEYTPAGSVTGGQVTIAAHSHSYTAPSAHTHSITLTDTSVTGTASVAVSSHTHSIAQHTHNVVI